MENKGIRLLMSFIYKNSNRFLFRILLINIISLLFVLKIITLSAQKVCKLHFFCSYKFILYHTTNAIKNTKSSSLRF